MNKEEVVLQRIICILADNVEEMCCVNDPFCIEDVDMNEIQRVATEIVAIFEWSGNK